MLYEQFLELYHAGKYSEALPVAEQCVKQAREKYGENHFEYAIALNNLAEIYRTQNRLDEAEGLFQQALQIEEVTLGPSHNNVAIRLYNLARLHDDRGRYDNAEALLYRALQIWEANLGPNHQQLGIVLNTLGEIYVKQGRSDEAVSLFEHALGICENALGRDHAEVASILKNLSILYYDNGFPAESRPLMRRAIEIEEKLLGPQHITVAETLTKLGLIYQALGQVKDLEEALLKALKIYQASFAGDHPEITAIYSNLGDLYLQQERFEESQPYVEKAFNAHKMMLGMQDPKTALDLKNLTEIQCRLGQYEHAEAQFTHVLKVLGKTYGMEHFYVGIVFFDLGELYVVQEKFDDAQKWFERALGIFQKHYKPDHIKIGLVFYNLAKIFEYRGEVDQAGSAYKRSMDILEKKKGARHPLLVEIMYKLGKISHETGRYEEAESLYKMVLKIHEETVGAKHGSVADLLLNFTSLYETQSKYEEALPLYKYALDIRKDHSVANDPKLALAHLKIANSYQKQSNWTKANESFRIGNDIIANCLRNGQRQFVEELTIDGAPIVPWSFIEHSKTFYDLSQKEPDKSEEHRSEGFEFAQLAHAVSSLAVFERIGDGYDGEDQSLADLLSDRMELITKWRGNYQNLQETLTQASREKDKMAEATQRKLLENISENLTHLDNSLKEEFRDFNDLFTPMALSISETQGQLRKDEALIHFVFGKTQGLVWVITNDEDYWSPLQIGTDQLNQKIEKLQYGLDHKLWQTMGSATRGKEILDTEFNWGDYSHGNPLPFDLSIAHELYRDLFGSVSEYIEGTDLMIVAPEPLSRLPLQVLVTDDKKKGIPEKYAEYRKVSWMGQAHSISILPSVSSLRAMRGTLEISEPGTGYLGVCEAYQPDKTDMAEKKEPVVKPEDDDQDAPAEQPKKSSLARMANFSRGVLIDSNLLRYEIPEPSAEEEMRKVSRAFDAGDKEFVTGDDVSVSKFREMDQDGLLRNYGVLHFAANVVTSYKDQYLFEPAIQLKNAEEGTLLNIEEAFLKASDIAQMHFNADWVLLPAAHTAINVDTDIRYVNSLSRAFFFSGAQTLLFNMWEVNAETGGKLQREMFSVLKNSPEIGRSTALREAISNLLQDKSRPWNPHPSTWGAYVVIGEASAV
ncbi:MAG: tetratricopeptide repeat protein [Methyloligellaceae bacterium]